MKRCVFLFLLLKIQQCHALLACKESLLDAERGYSLLRSLLETLGADLEHAQHPQLREKEANSKWKLFCRSCMTTESGGIYGDKEYQWILKARYSLFCALYTSIIKADSGMVQMHIQHTVHFLLHGIRLSLSGFIDQLKQIVAENSRTRLNNAEITRLRERAPFLPLTSLGLSLLCGVTESSRFDNLMQVIFKYLDQMKWQDLSLALHVCRHTDVHNWHGYNNIGLKLLELPSSYNSRNLFQFCPSCTASLNSQRPREDSDDDNPAGFPNDVSVEDLQVVVNSYAPSTQQVRHLAQQLNRESEEDLPSCSNSVEGWSHVTVWDGVLGIDIRSLKEMIKEARNSKRTTTDWEGEFSYPFRNRLGKIIPPLADKMDENAPATSNYQKFQAGASSLRYGNPVFIHLLRHMTSTNERWEGIATGKEQSAENDLFQREPTDVSSLEQKMYTNVSITTKVSESFQRGNSVAVLPPENDETEGDSVLDASTGYRGRGHSSGRGIGTQRSTVVSDSRSTSKQSKVDTILRRGSTWVANSEEPRASQSSDGHNNLITEHGEPKAWIWDGARGDPSHGLFYPEVSSTETGTLANRWRIHCLEVVTRLVVESFALCENGGASQLSTTWFQEAIDHLMPHLLELPADVALVGDRSGGLTESNSGCVPDAAFTTLLSFLMRCHQSSQMGYLIHSICAWSSDVQQEICIPPGDTAHFSYGCCDRGSLLSPSPIFDCARLRVLDALLVTSRLRMCKLFAEQLEQSSTVDSKRIDKLIRQMENSKNDSKPRTATIASLGRFLDHDLECSACPDSLFDLVLRELLSDQPWIRLRAFGIIHANVSTPFTWLAHLSELNEDSPSAKFSDDGGAPPPPPAANSDAESATSNLPSKYPADSYYNVLCEDGVGIDTVLSSISKTQLLERNESGESAEEPTVDAHAEKLFSYYSRKLGLNLLSQRSDNDRIDFPNPFHPKASASSPLGLYQLHRLHMAIFNALCESTGMNVSLKYGEDSCFESVRSILKSSRYPVKVSKDILLPMTTVKVGVITASLRIISSLFTCIGCTEVWYAAQLANRLEQASEELSNNAFPSAELSNSVYLLEYCRSSILCIIAVRSLLYIGPSSATQSNEETVNQDARAKVQDAFHRILRRTVQYSSSVGFLCLGNDHQRPLQEWVSTRASLHTEMLSPVACVPILQYSPLNSGIRTRLVSWNTLKRVHDRIHDQTIDDTLSVYEFATTILNAPAFKAISHRILKDRRKFLQRCFPFVKTDWQVTPFIGRECGLEYSASVHKTLEHYVRMVSAKDTNGDPLTSVYPPTKTRQSILYALAKSTDEDEEAAKGLPQASLILQQTSDDLNQDISLRLYWINPLAVASAEYVLNRTIFKWVPQQKSLFTKFKESIPEFSVSEVLRSMVRSPDDCQGVIELLLCSSLPLLSPSEIFEIRVENADGNRIDTVEEITSVDSVASQNDVDLNWDSIQDKQVSPNGRSARGSSSGRHSPEEVIHGNETQEYSKIEDPVTGSVFQSIKPVDITRMLSISSAEAEDTGTTKRSPPSTGVNSICHQGHDPENNWIMFNLAGGHLNGDF